MSSPNRSTSDIEDAFSSMNILNYTSVSSDYFPASLGSNSFNSSENSKDNMIPPVFSSFYNNTYLKDVQAFYAKELPISSPDPITPPAILTPSPVLPPSLLFDPRYFFVPEELLPPKKRICSPSSSSTTLSNPSRNQTCDLVSPSSSVYTPTAPQILEIGKSSIKMHLKHHEEQIEDILNYLNELSFHRIERMEEGRINGNKLKTELKRIRTQIIKLQKKQLGQKDKIAFAHYRISDLEQIIEKIQARKLLADIVSTLAVPRPKAVSSINRTVSLVVPEGKVVGAACGVLDQMASACCEANKLLAMVFQFPMSENRSLYGKMIKSTASDISSQSYSNCNENNIDELEEYEIELLHAEASLDYLCNLTPHNLKLSDTLSCEAFLTKYDHHNDPVTLKSLWFASIIGFLSLWFAAILRRVS
ncbi:hypothetical protein Tco_0874043 [Tanacetum coccineum]|uniref:Uncharacterized protein n=1 Tax=Tanacetum coccineum TaxID=301880 RepID=A0ABQ5BNC2_9ASTR